MIIEKTVLQRDEPQAKNVLWVKPTDDGAEVLAFNNGKWKKVSGGEKKEEEEEENVDVLVVHAVKKLKDFAFDFIYYNEDEDGNSSAEYKTFSKKLYIPYLDTTYEEIKKALDEGKKVYYYNDLKADGNASDYDDWPPSDNKDFKLFALTTKCAIITAVTLAESGTDYQGLIDDFYGPNYGDYEENNVDRYYYTCTDAYTGAPFVLALSDYDCKAYYGGHCERDDGQDTYRSDTTNEMYLGLSEMSSCISVKESSSYASTSDVTALKDALNDKASSSEVNAVKTSLSSKASTSDVSSLREYIGNVNTYLNKCISTLNQRYINFANSENEDFSTFISHYKIGDTFTVSRAPYRNNVATFYYYTNSKDSSFDDDSDNYYFYEIGHNYEQTTDIWDDDEDPKYETLKEIAYFAGCYDNVIYIFQHSGTTVTYLQKIALYGLSDVSTQLTSMETRIKALEDKLSSSEQTETTSGTEAS